MIKRNLDGVYFRVKRDDKWDNICYSDLTEEEREEVCKDRNFEWMKSLANIMADSLRYIGDTLDLYSGTIEDEDK